MRASACQMSTGAVCRGQEHRSSLFTVCLPAAAVVAAAARCCWAVKFRLLAEQKPLFFVGMQSCRSGLKKSEEVGRRREETKLWAAVQMTKAMGRKAPQTNLASFTDQGSQDDQPITFLGRLKGFRTISQPSGQTTASSEPYDLRFWKFQKSKTIRQTRGHCQ